MPLKQRLPFKWTTFMTSQQIIREMMIDRKYDNIEEGIKTEEEFKEALKDTPIILRATRKEKTVLVFWFVEKINKERMNRVMSEVEEENLHKIILISNNGLANGVKKSIEGVESTFDFFDFTDTQYNPTKHVLVPKHTLLSKEESITLLTQYNITHKQLPSIRRSERIIRWYDWASGRIVLQETERSIVYLRIS